MDRDDDFFLIERARRNKEEYGLLYGKYKDKVFGYFVRRVGERATAEDLTQEVFLRAFMRLDAFCWVGYPYGAYLFAVARTVLASHFRNYRAHDPLDEDMSFVADAATNPVADHLDAMRQTEAVWGVADRLVPRRRNVFFLRYARHMPLKDIARAMRTSENAVKLALSRGRKQIVRSVCSGMTPFDSFARCNKQRRLGRAAVMSV